MKLINASKQLSHNNCFNNRYNFISIMKVCLIYISFGCFFVSSLPLNGHSSDPGQSLGDYTFTGLADDSQQDPSSPSLTPSSSSLSGSPSAGSVAGLISANGNNLDSAKEWIQLRNLLSELGQQKVLTPSTYRFREMLKKSDDHSKKIMLDRLSGHPMGKFLFTGHNLT
ncbi:uncharacterized protein LOC107363276 isoform X3 [Tetranychus urticae]|uniref:uncharacterized protein LOC107363276 isoform X3 n=1 Tax=Tetranychus urticae TaxID=32264 RepID=UPI00077B990D|nr:uncharacterized protein LOC107363276 isoform X3 [Tetranychus urticae]